MPTKDLALDLNEIHGQLAQLHRDLRAITDRDPEQEVQGVALPVIDAALAAAIRHLSPDDPLAHAARDLISVEQIELGEPVRAVDALLVVGQLLEALDPPPAQKPPPMVWSPDIRRPSQGPPAPLAAWRQFGVWHRVTGRHGRGRSLSPPRLHF